MAEIFRLPAISPTMELGTIVGWRIQEGERFSEGDVLLEIGTDKATMEAPIYESGVLLKQLVAEDDEVPVNAPIAIFGEEGEDPAELIAQAQQEMEALLKGGTSGGKGEPAAAEGAGPARPEEARPEAPAEAPPPSAAEPPPPPPAPEKVERTWMGRPLPLTFLDPPGDVRAAVGGGGRILASPLARKVAADLGVDLGRVRGSGPGGRVVRADVEEASRAPAVAAPGAVGAAVPDQTLKLTPMRKTIARRLLEVHREVPSFFLTASFDVGGFVALREQLKARLPDVKVSYNDMLLLAVARALRAFPEANASWTDKGIVRHGRVDVGVAVALDEGLITPVVRGADGLRLSEIAGTVRTLAGKARDGTLTPEEYEGNTFTVSNLGMFGIEHFTAIINPPASAILAVGALEQVPVVEDGQLTVGWRMRCTMTCDHRVIDGAVGARFLQVLRPFIEQPALMLV